MKKNNTRTPRKAKRMARIALLALLLLVILMAIQNVGKADKDTATAWVVCQPGDYVNARMNPSRKSQSVGRYDGADKVELDGKTSNGFAHCVDSTFEVCESWVYTGYLVFDEPEWLNGQTAIVTSNARLAARKNCTGEVRKWLNTGDEVQVFWWSEEWTVTNYGFIKTKYLELVGE